MKHSVRLLIAATLALGAATPAVASDLLYPGGALLTEGVAGKPYWAIQARCAGLYGATSNYYAEKGDAAEAEAAKALGVTFFRQALDRLMQDRGVPRAAAIEALSPGVVAGRSEGLSALADGGDGPASAWNFARSVCLDVRDAYAAL
ncbi:MAG: hypothetical protein K9G59_14565 [Caulobacter sp.]|nr:hypothetical protein [Caulobacter sp.]